VVLAMLAAWGCRDKRYVTCKSNEAYDPKLGVCYPCPTGTEVDHGSAICVPIPGWDGVAEEVADADGTSGPDGGSVPTDSTGKDGAEGDPDGRLFDGEGGAPEPEIKPGTGEVGAPCKMDLQCLDGHYCFDWPDGYCVSPDCTSDGGCPEGSSCLPLLENGQACFDGCEADEDCRPGYGCKGIPTLSGETKAVCHPAQGEGGKLGETCTDHAQCEASLACVKLGSASVCALTSCSPFELCPESSACVPWGILPLCLPVCAETPECVALAGESFVCSEMDTLEGDEVNVCSPVQQGLPIGELCYYSTECETGHCQLLISGKCSGLDDKECGGDGDCDEGLCVENPSVQKGVCSKACGPGDGCPAGTLCVLVGIEPRCLASCENQAGDCGPPGFGMKCTYGMLHYPTAPSGKYACYKPAGGQAGTPCSTEGDCISGVCYGLEGGTGYCATDCFSDQDCPFGTQCMSGTLIQEKSLCTRICHSYLDCGADFDCKNTVLDEQACILK